MSAELTEAHRAAQVQLGARTATLALSLWDLLDLENIDGSIGRWFSALAEVVAANHRASGELAGRYLAAHREIGVGAPPGSPVDAPDLNVQALRTSMLVTGPYRLRSNLAKGVGFDRAVDIARADSAGEAMRHALAGGRDRITAAVRSDPAIIGVQRVTSASPCHFCAMLASRGPVYRSEATAAFRPHSRCGCQPEPVYTRDAPLTPTAERFAAQWADAKSLASSEGIRPEVAFRRLHEGRT